MDRRKAKRKYGNAVGGRECACALLAALVLGWQTSAGSAQVHAFGVAPADSNVRQVEAAETLYRQAVLRSSRFTARDLRAAVRLYRASAGGFARAGSKQRAAAAEVEAGNTLNKMSGYEQAIDAFRRALALDGDEVASHGQKPTWDGARMRCAMQEQR
jgi:tetratricopeptide (TPR) repeat protein